MKAQSQQRKTFILLFVSGILICIMIVVYAKDREEGGADNVVVSEQPVGVVDEYREERASLIQSLQNTYLVGWRYEVGLTPDDHTFTSPVYGAVLQIRLGQRTGEGFGHSSLKMSTEDFIDEYTQESQKGLDALRYIFNLKQGSVVQIRDNIEAFLEDHRDTNHQLITYRLPNARQKDPEVVKYSLYLTPDPQEVGGDDTSPRLEVVMEYVTTA